MKTVAILLTSGLLALGAATTAIAATAQPVPQAAESAEGNIRAAFAQSFPGVTISTVTATPWPQVYEVITPEGILYADPTGHFAFNGKMVDVTTRANLTNERETELGRIDFKSLPFARAIKRVKGEGRRVIAVFADPDCPYCRRLENDLREVDDLTIYTFLLPIDSLHPAASAHAQGIWCAKDPAAAWSAWLVDKVEPPAATCDGVPVKELAALGDRLRIGGTPTIFLADGRRIPGYVPLADLENAIASVRPN